MELTAQEIHTGSKCDVSHVKRSSNVWLGDLTNPKFANFNEDLREKTPFKDLQFFISDKLRELEAEDERSASLEVRDVELAASGALSQDPPSVPKPLAATSSKVSSGSRSALRKPAGPKSRSR